MLPNWERARGKEEEEEGMEKGWCWTMGWLEEERIHMECERNSPLPPHPSQPPPSMLSPTLSRSSTP